MDHRSLTVTALASLSFSLFVGCAASPTDGPLEPGEPAPTEPHEPGPTEPDEPTPPDVTEPDEGETPVVCGEPGGLTELVVVAIKGSSEGSGVAIYGLTENGHVVDEGVHFDVALPQAIALNPSGTQALVTHSGPESTGGVAVIDLGTSPAGSALAEELPLPGRGTPRDVTFTSESSALIARIGPDVDDVIAIARDASGWRVVDTWEVPGEWPQFVRAMPGRPHEALLIRSNVLDPDSRAEVIPLSDSDGTIATEPGFEVGEERVSFLWVHPGGERAYVPGNNPIDVEPMNPSGVLHQITRSPEGTWTDMDEPFVVPNRGSLMAFSPEGSFGIIADSILSEWENPAGGTSLVTVEWSLDLLELDGAGAPQMANEGIVRFDANMVHDAEVAPSRHVVVARDAGASVPEYDDTLLVFTELDDGRWARVCEPFPMAGAAEMVVGSLPVR